MFTGFSNDRSSVSDSGYYINTYAVEVNGKILVDSRSAITSIKDDAAPYQIVTDGGEWSNGDVVSTDTTAATGIVGSTNGNTMTLSSSDESGTKRWIVDGGLKVTMDPKPSVVSTAYLTFDVAGNVTGMGPDIGFQPVTDTVLTFTDPAPTGQNWDTELPTGTKLRTQVKVTNDSATITSDWSNQVAGYELPLDADFQDVFLETTGRLYTFSNRADVHQGQLALEARANIRIALNDRYGITPADIENLFNEKQGK